MRKKAALAVLLGAVLVLALPLATHGAGNEFTVQGTVSGPGGPVAGASVLVEYLTKGGLPKRQIIVTTGVDGTWAYTGRAGTNRFTFSAAGYYTHVDLLDTTAGATYVLDAQLASVPPPMGSIEGRITSSSGTGLSGYVYFYKQNADGTWPTGYLAQVATRVDGTYSSGLLPLGTYKVRLFTVHTGVQWYQYVSSMDLATPVVLSTDGQVATGIDAQYPPPSP